jgi:SAM-dependent methyltransferase
MNSLVQRLIQKGPAGVARAVARRALAPLHHLRTAGAPRYRAPDARQLAEIEARLSALGVPAADYLAGTDAFDAFRARFPFPAHYHGGPEAGVYTEKVLEHFVAWDLLALGVRAERWPYVDIAGASSPWARLLRERGMEAFAIDLAPDPSLAALPYVLRGDATASPFGRASIGSASLQCAYEMFAGDADTRLLTELARVLRPGGRAVICPLYMHTEACYYQSPEHYGRALGDAGARRYLRPEAWNVAVSRKYSPQTLLERVWRPAETAGLVPQLHVLRNAEAFGPGIYLHFILTLDRRP